VVAALEQEDPAACSMCAELRNQLHLQLLQSKDSLALQCKADQIETMQCQLQHCIAENELFMARSAQNHLQSRSKQDVLTEQVAQQQVVIGLAEQKLTDLRKELSEANNACDRLSGKHQSLSDRERVSESQVALFEEGSSVLRTALEESRCELISALKDLEQAHIIGRAQSHQLQQLVAADTAARRKIIQLQKEISILRQPPKVALGHQSSTTTKNRKDGTKLVTQTIVPYVTVNGVRVADSAALLNESLKLQAEKEMEALEAVWAHSANPKIKTLKKQLAEQEAEQNVHVLAKDFGKAAELEEKNKAVEASIQKEMMASAAALEAAKLTTNPQNNSSPIRQLFLQSAPPQFTVEKEFDRSRNLQSMKVDGEEIVSGLSLCLSSESEWSPACVSVKQQFPACVAVKQQLCLSSESEWRPACVSVKQQLCLSSNRDPSPATASER